MDFEEFRKDKELTEVAIKEILNRFQDKYKVSVLSIDILTTQEMGAAYAQIRQTCLDIRI